MSFFIFSNNRAQTNVMWLVIVTVVFLAVALIIMFINYRTGSTATQFIDEAIGSCNTAQRQCACMISQVTQESPGVKGFDQVVQLEGCISSFDCPKVCDGTRENLIIQRDLAKKAYDSFVRENKGRYDNKNLIALGKERYFGYCCNVE